MKYNYEIMIIAIFVQEREIKKQQTVLRKGLIKMMVCLLDHLMKHLHHSMLRGKRTMVAHLLETTFIEP